MTDSQYGGMTVNERLYHAVLIDEFYESIEKRDSRRMIEILREVELGPENIKAILKNHLLPTDLIDNK